MSQGRKPVDIPIHPDVGCSYHDKCLTCPLALCRHDMPGGLQAAILLTEQIAEEKARRGRLGNDQIEAAKAIIAMVAEDHGITVKELTGRRRFRYLCKARFETYQRLREGLNMTLVGIGAVVGGRDHSTVMYGLRQVA